ncbi:hypothetical protein G6F57_000572 [Rhizopus arrhizus]|uniref:ZZ-type zinc finger-containing protein 3 n=1 Tax=Rhizopus oryzae TaxID=64495 RepID=A0A9P6XKB6_RHIOR|nr:hypothetical protein G6F23_000035 [Rhizopus arrhizus]KAG1427178.1 hypothetical protein G6F58_001140 [Rhizopus delemar]KAG0770578.1 hypothetical protein G6F24_000087 [Rhizopus arrhizus]KAG0797270.1 hypothetical protein G6F22_004731 [Rhizopus arrhizus]KAG0797374.1 hypothetical protein G6F21_000575 [Rhizopus arrhizus]
MPDTTPKEAQLEKESIESNEDCQLVLKAIHVLKQQLSKATNDLKVLETLKNEALTEPFEFIKSLKKSRTKVPKLQKVIATPDVEWSKYKYIPESRIASAQSFAQHLINRSTYKNILDTSIDLHNPSHTNHTTQYLQQELIKATQAMHQIPSRATSVSDFSEDENEEGGGGAEDLAVKTTPQSSLSGKGKGRRTSIMQPGVEIQPDVKPRLQSIEPRTPDELSIDSMDDKTPTFKQPWTDEEQQRLQELLDIYPDEPVQAQRFNKISKALGTRTPRQVASRVQKYFIKLAKLGLPVPGRITIPPSYMPKEKGNYRAKPKAKSSPGRVVKPPASLRTSGAGYNSVISGGITTSRISGAHYATSVGPPSAFMSDEEEDSRVNEMMRQSMISKNNNEASSSDLVIHEGFACDGCGTEPIVGVLYRCTVCDISEEVDLCGNCMEKGAFTNDHHTLDHTFEAVRTATPFPYYADNDYKSPEHLGEYSYLGI